MSVDFEREIFIIFDIFDENLKICENLSNSIKNRCSGQDFLRTSALINEKCCSELVSKLKFIVKRSSIWDFWIFHGKSKKLENWVSEDDFQWKLEDFLRTRALEIDSDS